MTPDEQDPGTGAAFEQWLQSQRPALHRYCARMTGSAFDGEDVLQEAMLKAVEARPREGHILHPRAWLFRVAHHAAIDFLRRERRLEDSMPNEEIEWLAQPVQVAHPPDTLATSLATFAQLPATQRGVVVLRDVLGYSLQESAGIVEMSLPAAKSALQRGRQRLRELGRAAPLPVRRLAGDEQARLLEYVRCFNEGEFDRVRDLLAEDVRLDLVTRFRARGRQQVREYFHRYEQAARWHFAPGLLDGMPALLAFDRDDPDGPLSHAVALGFQRDGLARIRDFLYVPGQLSGAAIHRLRPVAERASGTG